MNDAINFLRMIMSLMLALSEARESCKGECLCPVHDVDLAAIMGKYR